MSKKVNIEVPITAIKGECTCPIGWFEELFENGYAVVLKIMDSNCVVKEISSMQELKDYVE